MLVRFDFVIDLDNQFLRDDICFVKLIIDSYHGLFFSLKAIISADYLHISINSLDYKQMGVVISGKVIALIYVLFCFILRLYVSCLIHFHMYT